MRPETAHTGAPYLYTDPQAAALSDHEESSSDEQIPSQKKDKQAKVQAEPVEEGEEEEEEEDEEDDDEAGLDE